MLLGALREFVESLAGQQIITLFLIAVGMYVLDPSGRQEAAKQIIAFSLGVMSRSMQTTFKGASSASDNHG